MWLWRVACEVGWSAYPGSESGRCFHSNYHRLRLKRGRRNDKDGNRTVRRIVAIGGGEIRTSETYEIDAHIVGLAKKKSPTALFIPTASDDSEGYWEAFQSVYGDRLGCVTQVLLLQKDPPEPTIARETILNADLIYVGCGNTLRLMRTWRRHRIDVVLEEAADKGVVLSGVSAGAMCWFKYGNRLPPSAGESDHGAYVRLRGAGSGRWPVLSASQLRATSQVIARHDFRIRRDGTWS